MFGYIYKTTNNKTKEVYIGQHHGPFDESYFGSGSKIKRSDKANLMVEFISEAKDQEDLDLKEIEQIRLAKDSGNLILNILPGGRGTKPEIMLKIGSCLRGKKKSPEHVKKLRAWLSSDRFKEIMRKANDGKTIPEHLKIAHSIFMTGRTHSEETKLKMSATQRNRPKPSEETRNKLRETWKRRKESGEFVPKSTKQKEKEKDTSCA